MRGRLIIPGPRHLACRGATISGCLATSRATPLPHAHLARPPTRRPGTRAGGRGRAGRGRNPRKAPLPQGFEQVRPRHGIGWGLAGGGLAGGDQRKPVGAVELVAYGVPGSRTRVRPSAAPAVQGARWQRLCLTPISLRATEPALHAGGVGAKPAGAMTFGLGPRGAAGSSPLTVTMDDWGDDWGVAPGGRRG